MKRGTKKEPKSYGKQKALRLPMELRNRINKAKGRKLSVTGQDSLSDQAFYIELLEIGLKNFVL